MVNTVVNTVRVDSELSLEEEKRIKLKRFYLPSPIILNQFILDFTSTNLSAYISAHNHTFGDIFKISRGWGCGLNAERLHLLKLQPLH